MKKIVLNKFFLVIWIIFSTLFGVGTIAVYVKSQSFLVTLTIFPWFLLVAIGGFFATNRICSVVKICFDKKYISRKGIFFGFIAVINFDEIVKIDRYFMARNGDFVIICSKDHFNIDAIMQNSAIFIPFKPENIDIVREVCKLSPNAQFDEKSLFSLR